MKSNAVKYKGFTYRSAANIRVKQALQKIDLEIGKVSEQVRLYSGVSATDTKAVVASCEHIIATCQEIIDEAKTPVDQNDTKL